MRGRLRPLASEGNEPAVTISRPRPLFGIDVSDLGDFTACIIESPKGGPTLEDGTLMCRLAGSADMRAVGRLEAFLARVHQTAIGNALSKVTVDLRDLEFMNSSCFMSLVLWLTCVQEVRKSGRYTVTVKSNPNKVWQRRGLSELRMYATDILTIET
jgi:hypothetical protein